MKYTNEEIARAAGYDWPFLINTPDVREGYMPLFTEDPGGVATWLLPVLEKRWPEYVTTRSFTPADPSKEILDGATEFPYAIWQSEFRIGDGSNGVTAPTWHLAVIEAIMATAEGGK